MEKMMFREPLSPVADDIAETFRIGKLTHCDINNHGISEMSVEWNRHIVALSWYHSREPRSLRIDDDSGFPKGKDSLHIFYAAWKRADQITSEMLNRLNEEVTENDRR